MWHHLHLHWHWGHHLGWLDCWGLRHMRSPNHISILWVHLWLHIPLWSRNQVVLLLTNACWPNNYLDFFIVLNSFQCFYFLCHILAVKCYESKTWRKIMLCNIASWKLLWNMKPLILRLHLVFRKWKIS